MAQKSTADGDPSGQQRSKNSERRNPGQQGESSGSSSLVRSDEGKGGRGQADGSREGSSSKDS